MLTAHSKEMLPDTPPKSSFT